MFDLKKKLPRHQSKQTKKKELFKLIVYAFQVLARLTQVTKINKITLPFLYNWNAG